MSQGIATLPLPVALDEDAVRRLCGPATFARADALQRAGHVLGPKTGGDGLTANVRGTWRRIDQVTILARTGRLFPTCARDGAGFCRHAGALLLHWLREPSSFATTAPLVADGPTAVPASRPVAAATAGERETPEAELARLLDFNTVNHLREIARRRGYRAAGGKKADVVRQLATDLCDAAGIDAALAALSPAERLALDAVHLGAAEVPAQPATIAEAFRLLGGEGEPPIAAAVDAGLALSPYVPYYGQQGYEGYVVPRAVAARLPTLDRLAGPVNPGVPSTSSDPASRSSSLGVVEMLQVVALEVLQGGVAAAPSAPLDALGSMPDGLGIDPADASSATLPQPYDLAAREDGLRLVPRRLLPETVLERLAARTGQPTAAIDFVARLMVALDIAQIGPEVAIRRDRLHALLERPPAVRLAMLANTWLATAGPSELGVLAGPGSRVHLRWHPVYAGWVQPLQPPIASAARLVARLVGRMTPERWYEVESLVELVERLAPTAAPRLAQIRHLLAGGQALALSRITRRGKEERLVLRTAEGWSHFLAALVSAILTGPLDWLGLVDVVSRADGSAAFCVRQTAGVLTDRGLAADAADRPGRLTIDDDLGVLVPAGTTDVAVHGLLARAGELIGASADGLRYRLTAAGMHAAFDAGTTGPDLAALLAERAGGALPAPVRTAIDRWWGGYGAIRLYDELTIIELGDDLLQTELLTATPRAAAAIHTFSPRLIAIDPSQAEELVAVLTARGYAPRVVEEG